MKLYLDENLSEKIAEGLRQRGIDAVGAREGGQGGAADLDQLRRATRDGRCVVTRDVRDFSPIAREMVRRDESHAGIILVSPAFRGDEYALLVESLLALVAAYPRGLADQVVYLPRPPS